MYMLHPNNGQRPSLQSPNNQSLMHRHTDTRRSTLRTKYQRLFTCLLTKLRWQLSFNSRVFLHFFWISEMALVINKFEILICFCQIGMGRVVVGRAID